MQEASPAQYRGFMTRGMFIFCTKWQIFIYCRTNCQVMTHLGCVWQQPPGHALHAEAGHGPLRAGAAVHRELLRPLHQHSAVKISQWEDRSAAAGPIRGHCVNIRVCAWAVCVAPLILSLVCLRGVPGEGTTITCCSFTFLGLSWAGPLMWWPLPGSIVTQAAPSVSVTDLATQNSCMIGQSGEWVSARPLSKPSFTIFKF